MVAEMATSGLWRRCSWKTIICASPNGVSSPGAATGYHRHAYDYVVVPVVDGELELIGPDGRKSRARLEQGKSYFRNAGVEHDVVNAGAGLMTFIEIELKGAGASSDRNGARVDWAFDRVASGRSALERGDTGNACGKSNTKTRDQLRHGRKLRPL